MAEKKPAPPRAVRQARRAVKRADTPAEKKDARSALKDAKAEAKANKTTPANYGFARAFLTTHPEIKALVNKAIKGEWTPDKFQYAVKDTAWYRQHTETQRQADLLQTSDPAQWQNQVNEATQKIQRAAAQAGVTVSAADAAQAAQLSIRNGWDDTDYQAWIGNHYTYSEDPAGAASTTIDQLRRMSQAYGVTLSNATLQAWTRQVLGGGAEAGDFEDRIREQAKVLFPGAAGWLDSGQTVADIASPYLEYASKLLNVPVSQMDITEPKWQKMLNGGQNGAMLSLEQFGKAIRTDSQYGWATSLDAKASAYSLANGLSQIMGRKAS